MWHTERTIVCVMILQIIANHADLIFIHVLPTVAAAAKAHAHKQFSQRHAESYKNRDLSHSFTVINPTVGEYQTVKLHERFQ